MVASLFFTIYRHNILLTFYLSSNLLSLRHKLPSVGNLACGCLVTRSSSSVPRPCHLLTPSIIHSGNMSSRVPQLTYIPSIFIMGIATFLPQVSFTREIWVVGSPNCHIFQVYSLWELPPSYIKYHSLWRYEELGSATRHICQARIWHTYVSSKRKLPGSREICGVFQVSMSRIFKWELPPSYGHIMGAIETFFSCWKPWTPI